MASADETPLMSHQEDDGPEDELHSDITDAEEADSQKRHGGGVGFFMWLLTLSACISGLVTPQNTPSLTPHSPNVTDDTGVISATLVSIGTSLSGRELTSLDKSVITSATALLALVASPLAAALADRAGRRPVLLAADALFVLGAVMQAASARVAGMVAGRAVVGLAVGAASFVTPLYVAELAPAAHRGRLVTVNVLCVPLGQVVAYVAGWAFAEWERGRDDPAHRPAQAWRWLVGLGAVPAVVQCVLLLAMPETPRWLVRAGRSAEARRVIQKTVGSSSDGGGGPDSARLVGGILRDIEVEVREEAESAKLTDSSEWMRGWQELLTVPKNRRALTIACLLQGLQQLCGFNSLMYFSATIFTILGFSVPTLTSLSVAATNFAFTAAALTLIDRVGRRRILLCSVPFMVVGLLLAAVGFRFFELPPAVGGADSPSSSRGAAVVILVSVMVYVAAYALGLGNVPWMQSELFPLSVRSLGSGVATCVNWSANFVVGLTFLPMMDALTPTWTFTLYAAVCAAGWVAIWMIYPETSGLTLEEATGLLEDGWGVR
ncbi:hypothetical protein DL762_008645 [Monosporascus cannonballus]|uniref:Major facilitator superfamily (MFS) profile domain-containing protein n=1 Tax=Monosporascus cannonballus TaxID=155416 RepID=A0ABY0GZJ9_9PEZI|nr:hypothetical protein DL762_008645 [Monosporascus cannonballus]